MPPVASTAIKVSFDRGFRPAAGASGTSAFAGGVGGWMAGAVAASGIAGRPILSVCSFGPGVPVPKQYRLLPANHREGVVDNTNSGLVCEERQLGCPFSSFCHR